MTCPICNTQTSSVFQKSGIAYDICPNCQCCFTLDEIVPETHNQASEGRNVDPINLERIRRIRFFNKGYKLVDFGCGKGQFSDLAKKNGYIVTMIDQDTEIQLDKLKSDRYNIINCVEVIEHLISPKEIVDHFHRILKPDGIVYIESSFTNFLGNPANAGYIHPDIGHVLVHSRKSIEMLFGKFEACWLNQNVVVFKKK